MKTKLSGIITLLLALFVQISFAQERTITGTVSDESGPLPGVSVLIEGTTRGTETDFDGKFSITAGTGEVLRFSFVGMTTVTRTIGAESVYNVSLVSSENTLDEVVVTALGIEREKKSLGYATQEVSGEQVNTVKEVNFVQGLQGKVAGLDVKNSGTMGGSSNVVIRGYSSLTGSNQALFVIDGVPVDNFNYNTSDQTTGRGGYDYGNGATDINPDDIETINVLKGGAATALYGSRAANGVIVITTKKGRAREDGAIGVSISSTITVNEYNPETMAKYQKEYGAGYGPFYDDDSGYFFLRDVNGDGIDDLTTPSTEDASMGAAFDPNLLVYQWESWFPSLTDTYQVPTPWVAAKNDPTSYFKTGHTLFNTIAIDGASDKGYFRLGYTNTNVEGILPNSEIKRDNIDFGASYKVTDKLTASVKAAYIKTKGKGRYGTGYDSENPMQQMRQWWQVNVDVQDQRRAYFATRENITWNPNDPVSDLHPIYSDNPYWTRYENYQDDIRNRVIGNVMLEYEITDWLNIMGRATLDYYSFFAQERINVGSSNVSAYSRGDIRYAENNYDLMLNFNKDLTDNINLLATVGTNIRRTSFSSIDATTNGGLNLPGLYSLENSTNPIAAPLETEWKQGVDGIFATASLGLFNTLFLEGSVRQDKFSTLPRDNDTALYWGASGSFLFSSLFDSNWLSLGKLRAGYATTGNGAPPYSVTNTYILNTPIGGQPTADLPGQNSNSELKPETSNEFEVGLEMAFWKNRVGFDVSYYDKESVDLITPLTVTAATGFTSQSLNAGKVQNKGWEVSGWVTPVRNDNFSWRIDVNWNKNENEVLALPADLESILLASVQGGVNITARVGQPYGTIEGTALIYDEASGKPVVRSNGYYDKTATKEVIGSFQPEWKGGIMNTFTWKGLKFNFLIDMQKGGELFSLDQWYGQGTGLYPETAGLNDLGNPLRDPVSAGGGVILDAVNADGTPNTTRVYAGWYANPWGWARAANEQHVYDAGFIKLREVALAYTLPKEWFRRSVVETMTFTALGRNLWIIDKDVPYADPEAGLSSGNIQGYQSGAYPSTRDYGFSVKIDF